ncbi:transporter associated domain-containing protein, partial [Candidatus Omnitrophota bacterium]
QLDNAQFLVSGKALITDVNEELGIDLPDEQGIMAGFILELFGKIPRAKEVIKYNNLSFEIEELAGKRIKSIRIQKHKK